MSTKPEFYTNELSIPENVTIQKEDNTIITKGSNGTVQKDFTKMPVAIEVKKDKVIIKSYSNRKSDYALVNTIKSIIQNMIKGSTTGFTYKLKIVFAHFPISVKIKGQEVHIENFFGERSSRISRIVGKETKVVVQGDDILVTGPNIESVSQTAANIESSTKIKNKDSRVFLDGVYIYSKAK
ncbi:50S ribosomal protein L6 [Candidatus Nitrosocosmicus franklandus]|uniref:Large ribosomal subunit protein uL6 n=1 Tax=Candidatus Nitrosocosmicus franklandianus TaxID=1798806 RepID=A0A484IHJ7_9ARCH|nr:50S ribosomal protein L6 [Candidatus Nitrosocosmicus franklandus]VFJ15482.1 50S ribosomal protein L6 [Candidatus Nitrosocosmicus franklandus]